MSVTWGCRVSCSQPGCNQSVTSWSSKGTPELPLIGVHEGGNLKGWCFLYRGGKYKPVDYSTRHIAYCPAHKGPAIKWLSEWSLWKEARERRKVDGATWWEKVLAFQNPEVGARTVRFRIQEADREWIKENPPPKPPWRT